ncbi:MAG: PKD domain-containing protein [Anaerolineales bacterium]
MRTAVTLLTAACLTSLAAPSANAAAGPKHSPQPPELYTLDTTPRPPKGGPSGLPDAAEEFLIEVDPEAVAANPAAFTIYLPTLPPLEALRTRFVIYRQDWKSWIGTLRHAGTRGEGAGYIHVGYHGRQLTALIHFEGERYQIVGGLWEPHRLVRLSDELSVRSCGMDDSAGVANPLPLGGTSQNAEPEPSVGVLTSTRIDVLAVYPKVFFSFGPVEEATVFNYVEDSISLANDLFANSNVSASYTLVGIVPITGAAQPPATGAFDALDWLTQQPTEVANLRNAFGADVVTIIVPYIWTLNPVCGVANLPQNNNTFLSARGTNQITVFAPMGDRTFTANRVSCGLGDFTVGHEIGHNYGMYHGDRPISPVAIFPHGRGHVFTGMSGQTKATVMGCYCVSGCSAGTNAICNRIPHFSNPDISYDGVATGVPPNGGDPGRNNASVANTQRASYAGFRPQSANTPPFADFTVSCSGRTCTFNASSSTDNAPIPTTGYWWDFGDGTTGSGKIVSHTYSYGTFFWVHLVVKDSGGQTDVTLNSASPQ